MRGMRDDIKCPRKPSTSVWQILESILVCHECGASGKALAEAHTGTPMSSLEILHSYKRVEILHAF